MYGDPATLPKPTQYGCQCSGYVPHCELTSEPHCFLRNGVSDLGGYPIMQLQRAGAVGAKLLVTPKPSKIK